MKMETVEQTLERIAREVEHTPGGVLAFDGDGTLWSGDVGDELFMAVTGHDAVKEQALPRLKAMAAAHGLTEEGGTSTLARRLFSAFEAGVVSQRDVCELGAWMLAGWHADELRDFARGVVESHGLARRIQQETHRVLEWARACDIPCYVVSASPLPVVEAAARVVGLPPENVVATTPQESGGVVLPDVVSPIPYGPGKVSCLRARTQRPLYAAFGDNVFDLEMMAASRVPVAVRPKARLLERADSLPPLVQLHPIPAP
ncbi:HAD superfamily hydrolase [Myxococcus stipitatus DSM 14675]|uniref:HAD superfamily hydrolase n=1 Tax=Myxococcus stipitatus (strain DSM 14675 / JCM 12634 / Mx s8) TaxID=1278073 RepID=L7TXZ3_MYXSD|nr:HAD family hydrolase [Myxococcus stipitatus]AGC41396.1 HAD superfamily hydrolase [Myxococcus stipitatus DSM 14675]